MINEIATVDIINLAVDKLDNVSSETDIEKIQSAIKDAKDDLVTFKDKIQKEIDAFDEWAETQSNIDMQLELELNNGLEAEKIKQQTDPRHNQWGVQGDPNEKKGIH